MARRALLAGMLVVAAVGITGSAASRGNREAQRGDAAPLILLVANQIDHTLVLVDPVERKAVGSVTVGVNGHEVVAAADGRFAYVPIYGNSGVGKPGTDGRSIDVINLRTQKLESSIDLGNAVRPHCAKFGPDGMLYVTAELAKAIYVIDPATRKVIGEIPTRQAESHMFVFSPDGKKIYTSNVGSGSVSVLDVVQRKWIATIPVARQIQRISISTDGRRVFTQDRETPRIAVIDTATNKLDSWIAVPELAFTSAATSDGKWLLATQDAGKLLAIDLSTGKISKTFEIPATTGEILIAGDMAYMSCLPAGVISVLNIRDWKMTAPITLTKGVDGLAVAAKLDSDGK